MSSEQKRSIGPMMLATTSSPAPPTLLLDPSTSSTAPCYFPDFPLFESSASDLRLARGFERASTVIARARVAGAAVR